MQDLKFTCRAGQVQVLVGLQHKALDLSALILLMLGDAAQLHCHRGADGHLCISAHDTWMPRSDGNLLCILVSVCRHAQPP